MPGPSRLILPVYQRSADGLYWPDYPQGNRPPPIRGQAVVGSAGAAALTTNLGSLSGHPSAIASASGALTTGGGTLVKWYPGIGMASDAQPMGPGRTLSYLQPEINQLTPFANLPLYRFMICWSFVEPTTRGTYTFTELKNILDTLQSLGKYAIIQFNPNRFNGGSTSPGVNDNSILPLYITHNVATYGPALGVTDPNGNGGYYAQTSNGYAANVSNANVMSAMTDMINAWGASNAGDSHPALAGVGLVENSNMEPVTAAGISSGHEARWLSIAQKLKAAFPHTPVYAQSSYSNIGLQSEYDQVGSLVANKILMGNSDCYPASHYAPSGGKPTTGAQWGISAWCGVPSSGITGVQDYRPQTRGIMESQEHEVIAIGGPISDFIAGANLLGVSHYLYTCVGTGRGAQTQNIWTNAAPVLNASTLLNTGYPPNF